MQPSRCRQTLLFCVCAIVASCASNPALIAWSDDVLVAERQLQHRQYDAALRSFTALEASAHFRFDRVEMRMRQAEVYRRQGAFSAASEILSKLDQSKEWVDREQHAKILYLLGRVYDDAGQTKRAQRHLMQVINHFPKTAFGWRAWVFMKPRLEERLSDVDFIELCRRMFQRHRDTPIADNFMYEAANRYFRMETSEGDKNAASLYERFLEIWILETSGFWDEVVWELSIVYHRMGRYQDEESLLQRLLATREPGGWPGTNDLKSYKYAYMRIAKLHMFELSQSEHAAELFHDYGRQYPASIFQDDMLWWEGYAWLRAGQRKKAQKTWASLKARFPESKYVRRLNEGHPGPTKETQIP